MAILLGWAGLAGGQEERFDGNMEGMTRPNRVQNGRFEKVTEVAYPWTGVDDAGYLRKAVAAIGVNLFVDRSNQFSYEHLPNSASFVDLDADGLPDLVAPDGAGMFWFWKNIGKPGEPAFGAGEVMPLLVDNERSRYRRLVGFGGEEDRELSSGERRQKERVDERREKAFERLKKENDRKGASERLPDSRLREMVEEEYPYPWEEGNASELGSTCAELNGFRQLRAVAAPCDWDGNGLLDFVVGDAQGTLYFAKNSGRPGAPGFKTFTKSADRIVLKLALNYNAVTRKSVYEPVEFINYAMPWVVDWDRSGFPDVLIGEGTYSVNSVRLFKDPIRFGQRPGAATNESVLVVGEERTFLAPFAWDWDGDRHLDLFVNDDRGGLRVYPNPDGRFTSGLEEMTESKLCRFEGEETNEFFEHCVPQPCDWNADGIMDLVWSGKFGRIYYALGKGKGSVEFGPPTAVRSVLAGKLPKLRVPVGVSFCAVPTLAPKKFSNGGTANAERFFSQDSQDRYNQEGWSERMTQVHGLMPSWDPAVWADASLDPRERYRIPKPFASWAVAPVPYEVFDVIEETPPSAGLGNTLRQTWHDTSRNALFREPRSEMTKFGQGVSIDFEPVRESKQSDERFADENIRCVFSMKLTGRWQRMQVHYGSRYWEKVDGKWEIRDGGQIWFQPMVPPPSGTWFKYDSTIPKGKLPRSINASLKIFLIGRGTVELRDVAVSTTSRPADTDVK